MSKIKNWYRNESAYGKEATKMAHTQELAMRQENVVSSAITANASGTAIGGGGLGEGACATNGTVPINPAGSSDQCTAWRIRYIRI